jgi:O-antigen ligase
LELGRTSVGTASSGRPEVVSWETLRYGLFFALFVLIWMFPNPNAVSFREDPGAGREGTAFIQIIWFGLLAAALLFCQDRWPQVRRQFDATLILLLAWCLFTVPFAIVPDVSFRRFLFTAISMFMVVFVFGGLERSRTILDLLLIALVVETITKFVFVFGFPSLGRHVTDSLEPQLAGLWRGQYAHKNMAGPICAIELFILYAARTRIPAGYLLFIASFEVLFLIMSGSKTPLVIMASVMLLAKLMLRLRSFWAMLGVAAGAVALINTSTVLTVASDDVRSFMTWVLGDSSFTGRADIWAILLDYAVDHFWMGAGFLSYWQIGFLSPAMQDARSWASSAIYGHQGYLDLVVTIGVPGLILTLMFVLLRPSADLAVIRNRNNPLLEMYISFWLFGLLHNGTESNLLGRADAVWLFIIIGIVGIRRTRIEEVDTQGCGKYSRVPVASSWTDLKNWHKCNDR